LRAFDRSALGQEDDGLTVEHIIPGALGGTDKTLTCKKCNNTHGSELEGHLVRKIEAQDWAAGGDRQMKGTFTMGDIQLPMKIGWGETKTMRIPGGKPSILEKVPERMQAVQDGDTFSIHVSLNFIEANARRAFLRIGYLALFDSLGYSYVLSPAASCVRKLIDGAEADKIVRLMMQMTNVKESEPTPPLIVLPLGNEVATLAYMVMVRIDSPRQLRKGILLPSERLPEESALPVLLEIAPQLHEKSFNLNVAVPG
jgi:HNH endonuclease